MKKPYSKSSSIAGAGVLCLLALSMAPGVVDARAPDASTRSGDGLGALEARVAAAPRDVPLLNELAVAQARAGRLEEALATLEQALAATPVYDVLYRNLVAVKQALALDGYRRSLQLPADEMEPPVLASMPLGMDVAAAPDAARPAPEGPERFVRTWAAAWARQDVEAYLGAYVAGYSDTPERDHEAWRAFRTERVTAPGRIEIDIDDLQVRQISRATAVVEFDQRYRSDTFGDRTRKLLLLAATDAGWRIVKEYSVQ